jgi:hypothetical protein
MTGNFRRVTMTQFYKVRQRIERMRIPAGYGGVVSISDVSGRVINWNGRETKRRVYAFDSTEYGLSGYQTVYTNLGEILAAAKADCKGEPYYARHSFRVQLL